MPNEIVEETIHFRAEGLSLEGILAYPVDAAPHSSILILAPHPHMGGRMDNNVVRHLARRGAEEGAATLRFNYRGVGASEIGLPEGTSSYDHFAAMEREQRYEELVPDALAAHSALAAAAGPLPRRILVGYSLGAILAGMLASRVEATHVVAVSPPVARVSLEPYKSYAGPKLFIAGDADFAFDLERFKTEYEALPEPKRFECMSDADHFFRKEEERVQRALAEWISEDEGGDPV